MIGVKDDYFDIIGSISLEFCYLFLEMYSKNSICNSWYIKDILFILL